MPGFTGHSINWAASGLTTIMRYPTLASLCDAEEANSPPRGTPLSDDGTTNRNYDDADSSSHERVPTHLHSHGPEDDPVNGGHYLPRRTASPPTVDTDDIPSRDSSHPIVDIERHSLTADGLVTDRDTSTTLQFVPRSSRFSDARATSRRGGRKMDTPYKLPDYSPNDTPKFKEHSTRQAFSVRFYKLCNDKPITSPLPLQQTVREHDLFLHIHRAGAQRDLQRPENVLFKNVTVWCYSQQSDCWERIEFGQERFINERCLVLTISKQFDPSWVLPGTMDKDKRWRRLTAD
ncbi:hypothetical protein K435DRAFT_853512 [Dendrothele bispora CBS 962.96]|uniref:Uncharacterized protein n=1 Tax=Dendrothele bispora (strain CBS 962.96) TaxID=1314807 RepID=A0A4S8MG59_DENBC|nr:hypothetical protein K435DRAFT_853512 [Dendrothele bispora CBS 962.96]